jgi:predicted nuclease of predicted toxin-antitoxin system
MQVKFLTDMGVSPRCVEWLRSQGYDAVHLYEQNLHKLPDSAVLQKATSEKRVLLTMDLDFTRLYANTDTYNLPLVVIFRLSDQRPYNVQSKLKLIMPILKQYAEQGNAIMSVSDYKVRIRRFPIS